MTVAFLQAASATAWVPSSDLLGCASAEVLSVLAAGDLVGTLVSASAPGSSAPWSLVAAPVAEAAEPESAGWV